MLAAPPEVAGLPCTQDFYNVQGFQQCAARRLSAPFNLSKPCPPSCGAQILMQPAEATTRPLGRRGSLGRWLADNAGSHQEAGFADGVDVKHIWPCEAYLGGLVVLLPLESQNSKGQHMRSGMQALC
jgi:hypothetical protein